MDINENEEHLEELEPLGDTAESAVDTEADNLSPAIVEQEILADLEPLAEEEVDDVELSWQ